MDMEEDRSVNNKMLTRENRATCLHSFLNSKMAIFLLIPLILLTPPPNFKLKRLIRSLLCISVKEVPFI